MKFFSLNPKFAIAVSVLLAVALVGFARTKSVPSITTDPEISTIISQVDSNRILNTATTLQNFGTRQSCSTQLASSRQGVTPARDFLFSQYSAIPGLQVRLDPFVHSQCPTSPTFNVIAWLPGNTPNRLVIIGGHYDSRTTNVFDNTSPAPGGNDSGAFCRAGPRCPWNGGGLRSLGEWNGRWRVHARRFWRWTP